MDNQKWSWGRAVLVLFVFGLLSFLVGEIGIRIRDRIVSGTPILANPTYSSTLRIRKYGIWVGKPNAHYRKWKLNAFGFRSEPITLHEKPGCTRIMILGASEMFGLYESPGKDFAADLTRDLKPRGCFTVINAAMAGMGIMAAKVYWDHYLYRFRPNYVLIYPAPDISFIVYLHTPHGAHAKNDTRKPTAHHLAAGTEWHFHSRLLDYLHSFVHMPQAIADWRTRRNIEAMIHAHPKSWRIRQVPKAVIARYTKALTALIKDIQSSGSAPILMTHALRITRKTYKSDEPATLWVLSAGPQATIQAWLENDTRSNTAMKEIAAQYKLHVVHLSRKMSGCRACFFDGAHFTNLGAKIAANTATKVIVEVADKQRAGAYDTTRAVAPGK